ncbi:MAG: methyltransferase [Acidobacteriota bacterium]
MDANQPTVTPEKIMQDLWAARNTMALVSGVDLDVFTHIAQGKNTLNDLAKATKASKRGLSHLLDALVGTGYLNKKGDKYGLEPVSAAFLIKGQNPYMGAFAQETKLNYDAWGQLTEVVKTGRPIVAVDQEQAGRDFFPRLVAAIFPMSFGGASAVAASLPEKKRKQIKEILDVAAGSAAWSLAFAQAIPDARVTVLDYPEVTPIARQFVDSFGLNDRYTYIDGNLREINFGRNKYDLILLGHIIHSEGEKWGKKLIKKCAAALKEGGILLIAEMVPNDTRTGPAMPLVFGLNMLIHTKEGSVFTMKEYKVWLKEAGFKRIWTVDAPAPSPIILASK